MMSSTAKPKQTPQELITFLRDQKGVSFRRMTEQAAIVHLSERNNYLRTASYRKNYQQFDKGAKKGQYRNLDFAYLVELSTIDMHMRPLLLSMCIDVEHDLKRLLLRHIETNNNEDGYEIVDSFLQENSHILSDIERKADTIFNGDLINKYFSLCYVFDSTNSYVELKILNYHCPVWVLVELISFGDTLKLIKLYNNRNPSDRINIDTSILNPIKSLRNACAHNNCLLCSLSKTTHTHPPRAISQFISHMAHVRTEEHQKKLSCRPLFEIACLLYYYNSFVSPSVRKNGIKALYFFSSTRMVAHLDYFQDNSLVKTSLQFLQKMIDNLA